MKKSSDHTKVHNVQLEWPNSYYGGTGNVHHSRPALSKTEQRGTLTYQVADYVGDHP
jgi:hypothetical protein